MSDNQYDLAKAWEKMEENFNNCSGMVPVQGISLNPEYTEASDEDPGFDYIVANQKLDKIFRNVGSAAQSAEFGGNDAWLILGNFPVRVPGESATLLYAGDDTYKGRDGFYDIFKRTLLPSGEYEDETIDSGDYEPMLAKAINMRPMEEADTAQGAIERRDREERTSPTDRLKTLKLDGPMADLLDRDMKQNGNVEWTDGAQGNGPYLPKEVENYILGAVGNTTDEPFTVRFLKYGSSSPLEGRGAPMYIEYEQDVVNDPREFGNRDMDESTSSLPVDELHKLLRIEDLGDSVDIYVGIVKIGSLEQDESGWGVSILGKPLASILETKEEAFASLVNYLNHTN